MKYLISTLIIIMLTVSVAQGFLNQEPDNSSQKLNEKENEITKEEIKEANEFARLFIDRMRQTRDVAPLIEEMFASNFKSLLKRDEDWSHLVGLPPALAKNFNEEEKLKYFTLDFSIQYNSRLYYSSKIPYESNPDVEIISNNTFPPEIMDYIKSTEQSLKEVKPEEQIHVSLNFNSNLHEKVKAYLNNNPPEETKIFKENLIAFDKHLDDKQNNVGRPSAKVLRHKIEGFPVGTRIITMEIPFHIGLVLVKENGKLKILYLITVIPQD